MCGLAGIFHRDNAHPIDRQLLTAMSQAQKHRGPNGQGLWFARGVGLAHRRLAIIDPDHSHQPMVSRDGRLALIFNGAIYNFRELRADLMALGHRFDTQGDTEVLLHGYRQWQADLLPRLNGMFAFALYDADQDCLFLARDRLGQKPLHFARREDGSIYFAPEINSLRINPQINCNISEQAIEDYFAFGFIPEDRCIFEGIQKLPAGHFMRLARGQQPQPQSYWDADFSRRSSHSTAKLIEEFGHTLAQSVARHCVADVPLGIFLSGGIDSSTIAALMAPHVDGAGAAHSMSFVQGADEGAQARDLAHKLALRHHTHLIGPPGALDVAAIIHHFGEPFADASALTMLPLAAAASQTMRVALTGDGADELLAGYRRHRFHMVEERVRQAIPAALRSPLFGALGALYPRADFAPLWLRGRSTLQSIATHGAMAYARAVSMLVPEERKRLFTPSFLAALQGYRAEDRYISAIANAPAQTMLDRIQYADLKISLPGGILTKVDRTSMAHGLEVRSPFLDTEMIGLATQLPDALRLQAGQGKWILKTATQGVLPQAVRKRRKLGFVPPLRGWFRGPLADTALGLSHARFVQETGWFNATWIEEIARAHIAGKADWSRALWQLWIFSLWFDQHLGLDSAHPQNKGHLVAH